MNNKVKSKPKKVSKKSATKKSTKKVYKLKMFKNLSAKTMILGSILILGIVSITLGLILMLYIIITAPDFNENLLYKKEATIIYDINGKEMVRTGKDNIEIVTYDELPEVLIDAIIATEDSRFFQHTGLDAPRFLMATLGQLSGNSEAGGASTLSMQVIKNTYSNKAVNGIAGIMRKLQDVYMSIFKLESAYTKEEILEFYVNSQWLGNDNNLNYTTITGVEQGSWYLFGKSVSDLSLAEASLLAGMFQNPVYLNPYNYSKNARDRQTIVLTLMVRHGYITEEEKKAALNVPIEALLKEEKNSNNNNYLQASIDYVVKEVTNLTGLNPYYVPMEIYTTIDPEVQSAINDVETGKTYALPEKYGNLQFGVAITDVEDGSIVALGAGYNYHAKGNNRAILKRQPGSTAKPIFDYGPYIEYLNGSPGTNFLDERYSYTTGQNVNNWDHKYKGIISMRDALVASRNIPALQAFHAVQKNNKKDIENFAHKLGINYGSTLYESAAIGGFDGVTPLQLSAAYATFARGGYYIEPYSVTKIHLTEDDETMEFKYVKEKAMSAETAFMVTDMLVTGGKENVAGYQISGTDLGAKTGTTNISKKDSEALGVPTAAVPDNWLVTFNPKYAMTQWIGYDKLTPEHYITTATATQVRKGIAKAIGTQIYDRNLKFKAPSGVTYVNVEKDTFPLKLPSENTPDNMIKTEIFKKGTQPTEVSTRYQTLDDVTNLKVNTDGINVTVKWDEITTPDAINDTYLTEYFNEYFGNHATKYYQNRIAYNNNNIGTLVYEIYTKVNGTLKFIGSTSTNSYTFANDFNYSNEYVVKTSYSIFKNATSKGVSIKLDVPSIPVLPEDPEEPKLPEENE